MAKPDPGKLETKDLYKAAWDAAIEAVVETITDEDFYRKHVLKKDTDQK